MSLAESLRLTVSRTQTRLKEDLVGPKGIIAAFGILLALAAPFVLREFQLSVTLQILIFILAVSSWNLLAGYFGMFSFTHAALYGVGAYATVISAAEFGIPPLVALAIGGLVAGLFSLPITIPALRLSGSYLAMVTLAFAEIIHLAVITFRDVTNGPTGYTGFAPMFGGDRVTFYYFVLVLVFVLLIVQYALLVSRFGLIARAIREAEDAAQMLGNDTYRHKLVGFFIGSALAGVAGGLQAYNILIISPPMLELNQMIQFMAMSIIGGLGTFSGAILGVIAVVGVAELLRGVIEQRLLIWGLLLMLIILFFPDGIAGSTTQRDILKQQFDGFTDLFGDTKERDK
ncbi:branched-chain amino acid ABC transporter permease [Haladaptatus sp. DJG-WS-42]|uniref:branched-chain amino acid ABC transporter permease n=1 Tax=Haladaptatus sp. DJG-WS-42 TaxID=3120516 RepID=UPI0030CCB5B5